MDIIQLEQPEKRKRGRPKKIKQESKESKPNKTIKKGRSPNPKGIISKRFLKEYYIPRYTEFFGRLPKINWPKDIKLLNNLQWTYQDISMFECDNYFDFFVKICEKFFKDKSPFNLKGLWSIGCFYTIFDKIISVWENYSKDNVIDQLMEGFRLAYWNYTENKFEGSLVDKEEYFSYLYIILKPFWIQYGKVFSLKRFAEIYFLVFWEYNKNKNFDFDFCISKFSQDRFENWLKTDGVEILGLLPKDVGQITKEKLDLEFNLIQKEEQELLKNNV